MNKFKFGLFVLVLSSFAFSIKCAQQASQAEKEKEKMQGLLFSGVKVANFKAIEKALGNPNVNINAKNQDGETVLTLLAHPRMSNYDEGQIKKITVYLLDRGADLNIANSRGEKPLEIALAVSVKESPGIPKYINKPFIESADYWKNCPEFKTKLTPYLVDNTNLHGDLFPIVAEYAYESPDLESDKKMEEE